jgi:hypothetical protein
MFDKAFESNLSISMTRSGLLALLKKAGYSVPTQGNDVIVSRQAGNRG